MYLNEFKLKSEKELEQQDQYENLPNGVNLDNLIADSEKVWDIWITLGGES